MGRAGGRWWGLPPARTGLPSDQSAPGSVPPEVSGVGETELPPSTDGPAPRPPPPPPRPCGQSGSWPGAAGAVADGLVVLVVLSSVVWA